MPSDLAKTVMGWIGGLLLVAAAFGGTWLDGRHRGVTAERAIWQGKLLVAERAARLTETDLAALAAASAKRIAAKEGALHEQAQRQDAAWRALLASLPRCRVPRAVGVQLDAAGGLPAAPAVAEPPRADPDAAALDSLADLADTLDRVRDNYAICAANIGRLSEARDWYTDLRTRVNSGALQ